MGPIWVHIWECTPHFLWSCQRKRAVHGPKEKRFSSKLARSGKFGDADGCWPRLDKTRQVSSECAAPWQSSSLQAASCNVVSRSRVLIETPYFQPRCRSAGGVSKEGAAAPSLCRLKGWSRRGRPKSPSWRVFWTVHGPFSPRGENGGCICQPSSWLSLPRPGLDAIAHPHCGPAATAGLNTASAAGHWPPWPGRWRHLPPGSTAPWPG